MSEAVKCNGCGKEFPVDDLLIVDVGGADEYLCNKCFDDYVNEMAMGMKE